MKVTRDPATLLPVIKLDADNPHIKTRTIPLSDDVTLRDLYDGLMDRSAKEVVDYGRAKQIRDARFEKRKEYRDKRTGGLQVIRHLD